MRDLFEKIKRTSTGDLIVIGNSNSKDGDLVRNEGLSDGWLVRLNSNGIIQWSKTIGGSQNERFTDLLIDSNDDIVALGWTESSDVSISDAKGGKDVWLAKYNLSGNLLFSKNYGGCAAETGQAIVEKDAKYWILGNTQDWEGDFQNTRGEMDVFLAQMTNQGTLETVNIYGGNGTDGLRAASLNTGGSLFMAGYSMSNTGDVFDNNGAADFWLLKTEGEEEPTEPQTISLGDNISICEGNSVEIDISSECQGCSFEWNDGNTNPNRVLSPSSSTDYLVTIIDVEQIMTIGTMSIEVFPAVTVTIDETSITCNGRTDGALDLNISGGDANYNVLWNNGFTGTSLQNISSDIYQVTVTDGNGCTSSQNYILLNPTALEMTSTTNIMACHGDSTGSIELNVSGGTVPYTYEWSNNATTANNENLVSGDYSVVVTDANGCQLTASFLLGEYTPLGALENIAVPNLDAANGRITLTPFGGTSPYAIAWATGDDSFTIDNLEAGLYAYTITDGNGCMYEEDVQLGMSTATNDVFENEILVYPNPNNGLFVLELEMRSDITIYSVEGQSILEKTNSIGQTPIDLSAFPKGLYTIKVFQNGRQLIQKIVVQ